MMLRRRVLLGAAAAPLFAQALPWPEQQSPDNDRGRKLGAIAKSLRIQRNIEYARRVDRGLTLDVYSPIERGTKALPAILCFGLAAWAKDESAWRVDLNRLLPAPTLNIYPPAVVPRGCVVVGAQLRTSAEARFPAQLDDCRAAFRWLLDNAREWGVDPNRLALMGASASGHLVSLLALRDRVPVRAVCSFAGMYDFQLYTRDPGDGTVTPRIEAFLGPRGDSWRDASPARYIYRGAPPFFLMHGTDDVRVPYSQAVEFHRALRATGVDVEFFTLRGYGHGPLPGRASDPGYEVVDRHVENFLATHLNL